MDTYWRISSPWVWHMEQIHFWWNQIYVSIGWPGAPR